MVSQNWQENNSGLQHFFKKKTLAQMFSCKFCEISKNTFFAEHLWTTASEIFNKLLYILMVFVS